MMATKPTSLETGWKYDWAIDEFGGSQSMTTVTASRLVDPRWLTSNRTSIFECQIVSAVLSVKFTCNSERMDRHGRNGNSY